MRLGFLAVERDRHVAAPPRQRDGERRGERDALVGRTEQHVEREPGRVQRIGVALAERGQRGPGVEQAGIEEIRAGAPGFQRELAEAQHAAIEREVEEAEAMVVQGGVPAAGPA